ncbi:MAG: ABC-F family ATP-binding cassette domain-containing protein [Desulfuromonadaceae bacterium]
MLQLQKIELTYPGRTLFSGVSWHLRPGMRVGLCGENGAGKTTLLKMLAGQVEPDKGDIIMAKGTTVGYLPQEGLCYQGRTLYAEVESACTEVLALGREMKSLEQQIAIDANEDQMARYAEVQEQYRQRGGFTLEADLARVLHGLGFTTEDWDKPSENFSGGWQMRIALARLLMQRPSLLLLDEPTNHLDLPARDWLEQYLCNYPGTVVLVSHDRFFMDQVVERIVEVWNGAVTEYPGNYSLYLKERDRRVAALRAEKQQQDEEIARIEAFISRFRYQANKASQVQSRVKQLEKIERIKIPPQRKKIAFKFPAPPRSGKELVTLKHAAQQYGENLVLEDVNLCVTRGERMVLVGPNGAGKSTLMRLLSGVEQPSAGERILGHNVEMAYFAQDQAQVLDESKTVLEEITAHAPIDMVPRLRDVLGSFLFSGDDVHKPVPVLSGGERNRLALAILLLRPANLLLLDEPTNHLDLQSKDVLLEALSGYSGTLVFVSHDRYFVDQLSTRVVDVSTGTAEAYSGNYADFLRAKQGEGVNGHSSERVETLGHSTGSSNAPPDADKKQRKQDHARRREEQKRRRKLEKEVEKLEQQVTELEQSQQSLEQELADPDLYSDQVRFNAKTEEHAVLGKELEACYAKWESKQEELEK